MNRYWNRAAFPFELFLVFHPVGLSLSEYTKYLNRNNGHVQAGNVRQLGSRGVAQQTSENHPFIEIFDDFIEYLQLSPQ